MSGFKSQEDNPNSFTWKISGDKFRLDQDVTYYNEYAKRARDASDQQSVLKRPSIRPVCVIPDIVAIDILTKYGIDVHSPDFMNDTGGKRRLMSIIRTEYPNLLMSNIKRI